MKIAVTYENGKVFQHFGKTETFKVYEVEDGKVISSEVIGSNGEGHGALAGVLEGQGVDVLICGGLGGGAQAALAEAGIEVCSGAEGDADQAVEAYLKGELISTGVIIMKKRKDIPADRTVATVAAAAAVVAAEVISRHLKDQM